MPSQQRATSVSMWCEEKKSFSFNTSNGDNLKHPWPAGSVTLDWGEVCQLFVVAVEMSDYAEKLYTDNRDSS